MISAILAAAMVAAPVGFEWRITVTDDATKELKTYGSYERFTFPLGNWQCTAIPEEIEETKTRIQAMFVSCTLFSRGPKPEPLGMMGAYSKLCVEPTPQTPKALDNAMDGGFLATVKDGPGKKPRVWSVHGECVRN